MPDPSAVVSHLRKMTLLSHRLAEGATALSSVSPLIPLFTGARAAHNGFSFYVSLLQQRTNNPIEFGERRDNVIGAGVA